jgi:hypothetical protein
MQRGPIDPARKKAAASVLHYLFGADWGALYGLLRESVRVPPLLFGAAVWMVSDNLILPLFRVAAWPQHYPWKVHAYALQAHFAYGLGTAAAYSVLRKVGLFPLAVIPAALALQARAWFLSSQPAKLLFHNAPWPTRLGFGLVQKTAQA